MKLNLTLCALLAAALASCGDSAGNKKDNGVTGKVVIVDEKPEPPASEATRSDYSLSELMELEKHGDNAFWDALEAWIPTAIDEDLAKMYSHLSSDSQREEFSKLMATHDATKTLDIALRLLKGNDSRLVGIRAFWAIVKESPATGVQTALNLPPGTLRSSAFSALFDSGGWRSKKAELIAGAGDLYPGEQMALGTALAASPADVGLLEAELSTAPERTREAFAQTVAKLWVKKNHGDLEALTAQLPDDLKAPATQSYFTELSSTNPQAALALATQLGRKEVDVAARTWAGSDPVAAAEFFAERPEFESGLSQVFDHWLGVAPLEASKYASTQLKGRAAELAAAEIVEECLEHGDKAGAEKWLQTITDPDLKKAASSR